MVSRVSVGVIGSIVSRFTANLSGLWLHFEQSVRIEPDVPSVGTVYSYPFYEL